MDINNGMNLLPIRQTHADLSGSDVPVSLPTENVTVYAMPSMYIQRHFSGAEYYAKQDPIIEMPGRDNFYHSVIGGKAPSVPKSAARSQTNPVQFFSDLPQYLFLRAPTLDDALEMYSS